MKETEIVHLPDLLFVRFCEEQFGVNRGVYNTIDAWLYQEGVTDIIKRRNKIYDFLTQWIRNDTKKENGKIKVGHGNLRNKLNEHFRSSQIKKLNDYFDSLQYGRIS